jgi:hypothetical protein
VILPEVFVANLPEHEPDSIDVKKAEISSLASQNPSKTAGLLRGFMDERPTS